MDFQQENQIKHDKESRQKQQEYNDRLAPVRVQNEYNKENLETQHKYNLEIFKKQRKLTIIITIIIAICSFITGISGVLIGYYLSTTQKQPKLEIQPKISITQPQNTSDAQKVQPHPKTKKEAME